MEKTPFIGVLALQGDFAKHLEMLHQIGVHAREIRKPEELEGCDGLILPGGESTAILRQMHFIGLREKIQEFSKTKPLFGTCAGLILMAKEIVGYPMESFGLLDIAVERNAFGRQTESFTTELRVTLPTNEPRAVPAVFIRAPKIRQLSPHVKVLAAYHEEPVVVQQGRHLGATFHPELTADTTLHRYFVSLC